MDIVCISDTHNYHRQVQVPFGDVLVHAGDFTGRGYEHEVKDFADWFAGQPHPYKIVTPGNHDTCFEDMPLQAENWLLVDDDGKTRDIIYLLDKSITIEGVKFYGSPYQPEFCNWAFNLPRYGDDLYRKWEQIPEDTDVLITHGPPYRVLDWNTQKTRCGCRALRQRLQKIRPKAHIFGHIHEAYGHAKWNGISMVNASICTFFYKPTNAPLVIKVEGE